MRALTSRQRLALQAVQVGHVSTYTEGAVRSLIKRGFVIAEWKHGEPKSYHLTTAGREELTG